MKYYEILFNSSQMKRAGGVGFGVRAQSEGLPEEYLKAVKPGELYQKGKFRAVFANELVADTTKILGYPVQFSYRRMETPSGETLYVLRRNVALEFDYAYYETGKPTRPGNYAEHTLIFDEQPDPSIFQLLYEQPAAGTLAFRPVNRIPSPENEELRGYMLGRSEDFKREDRTVQSLYTAPISEEAYNILFHLVEARSLKRSLVVLIDETGKSTVMADLCRLARAYALDISFACAYTANFDPKAFEITYITEYNTAPTITETAGYIIRKAKEGSKIEAAEKYLPLLKRAVMEEDEAAWERVVSWLLRGDYTFVEGTSAEVSRKFFNYCSSPELFGVEELSNQPLMEVVARRHGSSSDHVLIHTRIEELVRGALASGEADRVVAALQLVDQVKRCGVNVAPAVQLLKEECSAWITATPERLAHFYSSLSVEIFDGWIVREQLHDRQAYLLDEALQPDLMRLYRYFYPNTVAATGSLLSRLLYKLTPENLALLLRDANPDALSRQGCYLDTIAQNSAYVDRLWAVLIADLGEGVRADLFEKFRTEWANEAFAPLFHYGFRNRLQAPLKLLATVGELVRKNGAFKSLLLEGERQSSVYRSLFAEVAPTIRRAEAPALLEQINRDLIEPLNGPTASFLYEWVILYHLLSGSWRGLPKSEPDALYEVALRVGDHSYLGEVAKQRLIETPESQSLQLRRIMQDLERCALLDDQLLAELLPTFATEKQHRLLELYFSVRQLPFKEALALVEQFDFVAEGELTLLLDYEAEYKSFCRNRKIKGFFTGIFGGKKDQK